MLKYPPSNAGDAYTSVHMTPELLSATAGARVFLGWVVVPLRAAAVVLRRRAT